jgi:hypothetical protein
MYKQTTRVEINRATKAKILIIHFLLHPEPSLPFILAEHMHLYT